MNSLKSTEFEFVFSFRASKRVKELFTTTESNRSYYHACGYPMAAQRFCDLNENTVTVNISFCFWV